MKKITFFYLEKCPYCKQARRALDELKAACITPEAITAVFGEDSGPLGRKMMDLALIYSAYEAALSREISDPADRLTRLAEKIGESSY